MKTYNITTSAQFTIQEADEDAMMAAAAQMPGVTDVALGGGWHEEE